MCNASSGMLHAQHVMRIPSSNCTSLRPANSSHSQNSLCANAINTPIPRCVEYPLLTADATSLTRSFLEKLTILPVRDRATLCMAPMHALKPC